MNKDYKIGHSRWYKDQKKEMNSAWRGFIEQQGIVLVIIIIAYLLFH